MSGDNDRFAGSLDPSLDRVDVLIEAMTPPGPPHLRRLEAEALAEGIPVIRPQTQNLIRFFLALKKPMRILEIGTATGFSALFMKYYAPAGCRIVTIEKDPERARRAADHFRSCLPGNGTSDSPDTCGEQRGAESGGGAETGAGTAPVKSTEEDAGTVPGKGAGKDAAGAVSGQNTVEDTGTTPGKGVGKDASGDSLDLSGVGGGIELLTGDAALLLPRIPGDASFDFIFMDAAKGQYIRFLPETLRLLRTGGILLTDNIFREGEILSSRFAVRRRSRTIHSRMRAYIRALMEEPLLETLLLSAGDGTAVSVKRDR
ncbi:MAG: class I SAM-dependent methyltransferase [Eubacteriales bacterium]|nr:class I SAM-dependent methyltransferase [Eubacteriales bacterium]